MVTDLAVITRSERPGYVEPEPGVDLAALVTETVLSWAERISALGRESDPGAPAVPVRLGPLAAASGPADPPRLTRALEELVAEAVAECPGGGVIEVGSTLVGEGDRRHLDLLIETVRPPGRPGPPVQQVGILRSGLGFEVARRLVAAHDGTVRHDPDWGRTTVRLPIGDEEDLENSDE